MQSPIADVAQTNLKQFDVIDFDNYKDGGSGSNYAPPPEGKYTGIAPIFKSDGTDVISDHNSFGRTAEGYPKVEIGGLKLQVPGRPEGYTIMYQQLSSKKYKNREGSQVMDFLRACGIAARPKTEDELRSAVKMASNRPCQLVIVWEAYNKDTKETTSGEENFPFLADGVTRQTFIKDEFDDTKKWYANGKVRYFISALNGKG